MKAVLMESRILRSDRSPLVISACCVSAIVAVMLWGYWDMPQDDSYIFYTYARNLADGHGYVFNIGERVNATTSPLYTLLLAVLYKLLSFILGATLPIIGRIIGGISLFFLSYFLSACFRNRERVFFACALPLVFLANPLLSCALGMELFLAMMLAVAGVAYYSKQRYTAAALLSALAVLARPDMIIVSGLMFIHYLIANRRLPRFAFITTFVVPITAWLVFSWFYFGSLLPSTFEAKLVQSEAELWGTGPVFFKGLFSASNWYGGYANREQVLPLVSLLFLIAVGLFAGILTLVARHREWPLTRHPAFQILTVWPLLHLVAYGLVLNAPAYSWYYTPLAVGMAVIITLPLEGIYRAVAGGQEITMKSFGLLLLFALTLTGAWLPIASLGHPASGELAVHQQAAVWLNEHARDGASVGVLDCDIIGYFYEKGPVIDGMGLVTPAVIPHVRNREFDWYVRQYRPDHVMIAHPPRGDIESFVTDDWFHQQYTQRKIIEADGLAVAIYDRLLP